MTPLLPREGRPLKTEWQPGLAGFKPLSFRIGSRRLENAQPFECVFPIARGMPNFLPKSNTPPGGMRTMRPPRQDMPIGQAHFIAGASVEIAAERIRANVQAANVQAFDACLTTCPAPRSERL